MDGGKAEEHGENDEDFPLDPLFLFACFLPCFRVRLVHLFGNNYIK